MGTISWSYVGKPTNAAPLVGYAEIARDPLTDDVAIPIRILRGPDAVIQRIRQRFRMFRGEWFLDKRLGIPYYEEILVKNPDVGVVTTIFRQVLTDTPGVARVASMKARVDRGARELVTSFEAVLEDPTIIVRAVDAPFQLR